MSLGMSEYNKSDNNYRRGTETVNTGGSGKPCCAQVKKSKNSDVDWTYMVSGIGMRQDFKEIDVIEDFWF